MLEGEILSQSRDGEVHTDDNKRGRSKNQLKSTSLHVAMDGRAAMTAYAHEGDRREASAPCMMPCTSDVSKVLVRGFGGYNS